MNVIPADILIGAMAAKSNKKITRICRGFGNLSDMNNGNK
ncbi:hypothetical protein SCA_0037 [Staphylococcus carnosus subsp. carnosus TM300]|uniref:Uncharacterized protein n=1 Tax=Staphylococcus carnosus (strain TM300) TaxID=396513 RepID=B9DIC9_STACT|nr:hypothetical protein SCA_0037 [Staphylococcus carnosus subsp. carnosus TM300]